jgi:phosphoribosylaminoimidazole-succinocarboxamide synthase
MPKLPSGVVTEPIPDLELLHRGKVRDTYALPGHPDKLLVVASDRLSIYDFVLPALVPQKGEILTAMNIFWRKMIGEQLHQDLYYHGIEIGSFLRHIPESLDLKRSCVVNKVAMYPCEAIVRGYLTGSGLKAYVKDQAICGHRMPNGLVDGDKLSFPIFTPTTKAEEGHDEHITADSVAEKYGAKIERASLQVYLAAEQFAREKGIILADTKFEWGKHPESGELVLADEVLTPDSSRFWDLAAWEKMQKSSMRSSPPSYDKQFVREWGKTQGIDKRNPCKPEDVEFVHGLEVPAEIIARTTKVYRYIFWRLTGMKLEVYQLEEMGLAVLPPKVRIEVVVGSKSDFSQMEAGLEILRRAKARDAAEVHLHAISCHRNPEELAQYAKEALEDVIVIAGAGMAAALPGVLKALLIKEGKPQIPVIGVAFAGKTQEDDQAARLSIERLPGQSVLLDWKGKAYFGSDGFAQACFTAINNEFLSEPAAKPKPAEFDLPLP